MHLVIDGEIRQFVDIKTFRTEQGLPPDFGVNCFEPKDYTGLGRMNHAGAELNSLRRAVLDIIPSHMTLHEWMTFLPDLGQSFRQKLYAINIHVGLREVEVEFAAAGFDDVCQALLYALMRAGKTNGADLDFEQIYADWLNSTVRVSQTIHPYTYGGQMWQAQIVNHVYGRVGLIVRTGNNTHFVGDSALTCPAEGFVETLLRDVATRTIAATTL